MKCESQMGRHTQDEDVQVHYTIQVYSLNVVVIGVGSTSIFFFFWGGANLIYTAIAVICAACMKSLERKILAPPVPRPMVVNILCTADQILPWYNM